MNTRGSGVLLHLTSLPSTYGVGDMGRNAFVFAELLARAGQRYWQILPLGPTNPALGNSPYSSSSAFAGNPLLICPESMADDGFLRPEEAQGLRVEDPRRVNFDAVARFKGRLLRSAPLASFTVSSPSLSAGSSTGGRTGKTYHRK